MEDRHPMVLQGLPMELRSPPMVLLNQLMVLQSPPMDLLSLPTEHRNRPMVTLHLLILPVAIRLVGPVGMHMAK